MSRIADGEQRVRQLAEAIVAIGSEISLNEVLQQTVDTAARLVGARWAALGVLDRTGSHLERFMTAGIDEETRARIGNVPGDHGVLRILLREGRPVRVAEVTKHPEFRAFRAGIRRCAASSASRSSVGTSCTGTSTSRRRSPATSPRRTRSS